MISIYDIKGWSDVAAFLIWTLAICAIAKAIFGSLLTAELQYRFSLRDAPRRQRMNRLNWEVNNRAAWSDDVARRSPHAAKQPLTEAEVEARRGQLQQLARKSFVARAMAYFMGCFACQAGWTALAVFAITRGPQEITAWVCSAAAYAGSAVVISAVWAARSPSIAHSVRSKPTCERCGG